MFQNPCTDHQVGVNGARGRSTLFSYFLRSQAPQQASLLLERMDAMTLTCLIDRLESRDHEALLRLLFLERHRSLTLSLSPVTLAKLCRTGDAEALRLGLTRLPDGLTKEIMTALPARRRRELEGASEGHLVGVWAALKRSVLGRNGADHEAA